MLGSNNVGKIDDDKTKNALTRKQYKNRLSMYRNLHYKNKTYNGTLYTVNAICLY